MKADKVDAHCLRGRTRVWETRNDICSSIDGAGDLRLETPPAEAARKGQGNG